MNIALPNHAEDLLDYFTEGDFSSLFVRHRRWRIYIYQSVFNVKSDKMEDHKKV